MRERVEAGDRHLPRGHLGRRLAGPPIILLLMPDMALARTSSTSVQMQIASSLNKNKMTKRSLDLSLILSLETDVIPCLDDRFPNYFI